MLMRLLRIFTFFLFVILIAGCKKDEAVSSVSLSGLLDSVGNQYGATHKFYYDHLGRVDSMKFSNTTYRFYYEGSSFLPFCVKDSIISISDNNIASITSTYASYDNNGRLLRDSSIDHQRFLSSNQVVYSSSSIEIRNHSYGPGFRTATYPLTPWRVDSLYFDNDSNLIRSRLRWGASQSYVNDYPEYSDIENPFRKLNISKGPVDKYLYYPLRTTYSNPWESKFFPKKYYASNDLYWSYEQNEKYEIVNSDYQVNGNNQLTSYYTVTNVYSGFPPYEQIASNGAVLQFHYRP